MLPQGQDAKQLGWYFALAQLGMEMAAPVGLGYWLDSLLGWFPWLTVVGTVLGLVLGFTHLILLLRRQDEMERRSPPSQGRDKSPPEQLP